jgi:GNAT superfamily N-acetyltransferase
MLIPHRRRSQKGRTAVTDTEVVQATTAAQLDEVRTLFGAFIEWHRNQHAADLELVDRYFDAGAFEREVTALPGQYAPPTGSLLLAMHDGRPAGCAALRELSDGACEMKRMFVPAEFRGLGLGRALAERLVSDARAAGYVRMRLDTSRRQEAAVGLYEASGFRRVPPYYDVPDDLRDWLVFLERDV